jgi:hypothetical protein
MNEILEIMPAKPAYTVIGNTLTLWAKAHAWHFSQ